jgi:hypothetical protein
MPEPCAQMWFMRSAVRVWAASSASAEHTVGAGRGGPQSGGEQSGVVGGGEVEQAGQPREEGDQLGALGPVVAAFELLGVGVDQVGDVGVQPRVAEGGGGGRQEVDVGGGQGERGQRRVLVAAGRGEQPAAPRCPGLGGRQGGEQALHGGEGDPVGQWRRQPQRLGVGTHIPRVVVLPRAQAQQDLLQGAQRRQRLAVEVDDEHGPLPWPGFLAPSGVAGRLLSHGRTTARWPTGRSCR